MSKLVLALGLMAACVAIHAGGVAVALSWLRRSSHREIKFWSGTGLLVRLAAWMIVLHLLEVIAWGLVYAWGGAFDDLHAALYFSVVTYTTTGYGDLTLPEAWRLVGGVEALTGILMCGLSTGFFFAVMSRMNPSRGQGGDASRTGPRQNSQDAAGRGVLPAHRNASERDGVIRHQAVEVPVERTVETALVHVPVRHEPVIADAKAQPSLRLPGQGGPVVLKATAVLIHRQVEPLAGQVE